MDKKEITEHWDEWWKETDIPDWDDIRQLVYEALLAEDISFKNEKILEAGSGSGAVSLKLAERGSKVFLLDTSKNALSYSKKKFLNKKVKAEFVCASIFHMPYKENVFDVVWNAGVLEHFFGEEQIDALKEMKRVCKKYGKIITMNPHSSAIFYRVGKWYAEKIGKWQYGYERPLKTLKNNFGKAGIIYKKEYNIGFAASLYFLRYIPFGGYFAKVIRRLEKIFTLLRFSGYLLITVGEKK
jgi:ubiquinone/menaquinone biosynthesis C-methylase UbiE